MNLTIIQKSIDYIEDNLKTDITAKELSEMAGFSIFHYYRLFQSAVGMPVAANVCGYTPINLGKIIKDGILSDIESIHRVTIDRAVERKMKRNE